MNSNSPIDNRNPDGTFKKGSSGNPLGIRKDATESKQYKPEMPSGAHFDGWASALMGIGHGATDKRESTGFMVRNLTYQDAIELWRGDDLAARAIESVAADCFREGYEITIGDKGHQFDDLKDDLLKRMSELKIDEIVERAYKYERAYGGAAILMGLDDGLELDEPADLAKVKGLNWLTVMEPIEIFPATYYQDPTSAKYGEPEFYRLQAFTMSGAGTVIGVTDRRAPPPTTHLIHESRLIVFGGKRVSRYQRNTGLMGPLWGDSVLVQLIEILRDFNVAWSATGILITDFAQTVISMENLMAIVDKAPEKFAARMRAMDMTRSVARAIAIDKNETLKRESTNVQGLAELLDRMSQRLAAAIDIPLSILMGNTPKGIGVQNDSDVRIYYDRVASVQRRRIGPILEFLASILMKTLRQRKVPKKWGIKFHPLWQLTDKEKAEARLTQARADSMMVKSGVVFPDEIRKSRFGGEYSYETVVDSSTEAPGIEELLPPGAKTQQGPSKPPGKGAPGGKSGGPGGVPAPKGAGNKVNNLGKLNGATAHGVRGYARRNPNSMTPRKRGPSIGGGDVAPENKADGIGGGGIGSAAAGEQRIQIKKRYAGLPVTVETPKGTARHWTDLDGTQGETTMQYDYGFVDGAQGADGDDVDCYLGPNENAENVYVIHQNQKPDFMLYDEDKTMIGWDSAAEAKDAYLAHYDNPGFFGGMTVMSMDQFKTQYLGSAVHTDLAYEGQIDIPPGTETPVDVPNSVNGPDEVVGTDANEDENELGGIDMDRMDFVEQRGSSWVVLNSDKTKTLGTYRSKAKAVKRLKQIEWFKSHPNQDDKYQGVKITQGGSQEAEALGYATDVPSDANASGNDLSQSELHTNPIDEDD